MKIAVRNDVGETLSTVELEPKMFSTGSRGLFKTFKVEEGGKRYQGQVQLIEIGSKPGK